MTLLKDRLIANMTGDSGADTLRRFFAQIEYTAFWCIRMLRPTEGIDAVVPEAFEDVLVVRPDCYDLRQVKARDESAGPWTVAEVLPVLVKQYAQSRNLDRRCTFHFASNRLADTRTTFTKGGMGALYDLKILLEAIHLGSALSPAEKEQLDKFKDTLLPRLETALKPTDGRACPDRAAVEALLLETRIETDCPYVAYPNTTYAYCNNNLTELDDALTLLYPGSPPLSLHALGAMYAQVLNLVYERIRTGTSIENRRITATDLLQCRVVPVAEDGLMQEIASAPGKTLLDKKAYLGGFDTTRRQNMYRQRATADILRRKLRPDDNLKWENFRTALLDRQISCMEAICGEKDCADRTGTRILESLRPHLRLVAKEHFPDRPDVTEQVCLGVLWDETDACRARWHTPAQGGARA
ncbi:MAG: hypothetical protein IMZ62_00415 [Chloroflexi bacterium]|nr:hypothetical protein [Chloroflexota bacterium]